MLVQYTRLSHGWAPQPVCLPIAGIHQFMGQRRCFYREGHSWWRRFWRTVGGSRRDLPLPLARAGAWRREGGETTNGIYFVLRCLNKLDIAP